ncbi:hypothetical protein MATR_32510 [Marivirga tractuosa]|uniref:Secreted protein n=1 Tax=Marivirga tractuosa (strain ATCC 23168 / DSM 4126 / NBRC 15989 / NCIMB 1408 / VKM B-1430 / H-43) TaxID=643867 RepID=E4TSV9_MARTH|nr:hypothetical protein [Marivirga tractuosa]ADR22900.1 secreted protein [Marivirga tractuosa DSM 4126]BDD16426.1 hypothetical protein MATR_32510 [Marivirga tractuosa]
MKNIGLIIFLLILSTTAQGQANEFRNQRAQFTALNIGFNGLVGGLGGLINNNGNKSGFQAFSKGFYQGAIGGAVSHIGFSLTHQVQKQRNISYAWPARIVNSLGSSIIQNAAEGQRMFERLHLNLYITRLEYYPYQKKFRGRLFTSSIYGILVAGRNAKLDIKKSLQTGILYFETSQYFSSAIGSGSATGQVSSIGMSSGFSDDRYYSIYAHEVAHILQYDRMVGPNAFLHSFDQNLKSKYTLYKNLSKFIYFDLNGPIFFLAYKAAGSTHNCNFFEQEAENYSNRVAYTCN